MRTALLAVLLALGLGAAQAQQLYRWTDEKGRVHITDTPPPASAKGVRKAGAPKPEPAPAPQPSFELTQAMKDFPVTLYTSPDCKSACAEARETLNKRGVPFREVQVADEDGVEGLKRATGANQVPAIVVGKSVHRGFEANAWNALLDSARYPKAGSVPSRNQAAAPPPDAGGAASKPEAAAEERPTGPYAPGGPRPSPKK